jgi:hypothetical protein
VEVAHMIQFAQAFPVEAIVATLSQQLSCKTLNPRETEQPLETGSGHLTVRFACSRAVAWRARRRSAMWQRNPWTGHPPEARAGLRKSQELGVPRQFFSAKKA